ncbi:MAG: competence/damage-inducible protein A [Armatimonadetes bacterium]|nr:competence/damage-inducible protein A [Armatimonadota bacterium]MCX7966883.1 competence/damage-inducible protein A [Armatimonadota bacterium]MDW8141841.1 competence/damage-inducible protein A [Armatimonadota bacterium]
MNAEIISVGTELLLGQIVDTNAGYLSQQLAKLGIDLYRRSTVGDNRQRIADAVRESLSRAEIVLITGGLGPTPDDVTAAGIADAFGVPLVRHPEAEKWLTDLLLRRGITPSQTLLKQADLPEGASWLPNPVGTAPGIWIERDGKIAIAMPGVPAEMEAMFEQEVIPRLQKRLSGEVLRWRILRFSGIGESALTDRLGELMQNSNPTLGTLVKPGEIWLRVAAKAQTEGEANAMLDEMEAKIREKVGEWLIAVGEEPIEVLVGEKLKAKGLTIATAESITGGSVCSTLINVPGSSLYVRGGVVAYCNAVKMHLLGVPWEVLQKEGAVSESCAWWMASQVRVRLKAHIGVATTGYAGPTGGEPDKPVGTVFIAVSTPAETRVERFQLRGTRQQIRERATYLALVQVLKVLERTQ